MSRRFIVEADGGSRGNPGPAGFGALVRDADTGELLVEIAHSIGVATNNVAEYSGLVAGLEAAVMLDRDCTIEVRMDSKLVVEQMSGRWSIKHEDMRRLALEARQLIPPQRVTYTWVPREQNSHADRLANEAMDGKRSGATLFVSPEAEALLESGPAEDLLGEATGRPPISQAWPGISPPVAEPDLGTPTTLLLIRHARTAYTGRTFTGGGPGEEGQGPPLDEPGEREAAALAAALATGRDDVPVPEAIICSPYLRTRQTAQALGAALGLAPAVDEDWVEVSSLEDASIEALWGRVSAARDRLLAAHPGRCVALVTHAGPVRALLSATLDAGPAAMWRLRVDPASLSVVRFWADGGCEVVTANDVSHLR
jgi:probable phosphoglycerate mutase